MKMLIAFATTPAITFTTAYVAGIDLIAKLTELLQ